MVLLVKYREKNFSLQINARMLQFNCQNLEFIFFFFYGYPINLKAFYAKLSDNYGRLINFQSSKELLNLRETETLFLEIFFNQSENSN